MVASDMPRCERIEKRADPTMMHTYIYETDMKYLKIRGFRTGSAKIELEGIP